MSGARRVIGGDFCPIGPLQAHTMNHEQTECIWCGPNALAWKPGHWVPVGNGFSAWSTAAPAEEVQPNG
jgi:hypothetical protein